MNRVSLFCLLLVFLVQMTSAKNQNKQENLFDKEFRKKMANCEKNVCYFLPTNFNENCVNQCISKKCYEQAFYNSGLEPGELDTKR